MFTFKNLIKNEYFPAELPPCFSTESISENYENINSWTSGINKKQSIALKYSGFKNINARRKFAVPNIYHYFKTVNCIIKYSSEIFKVLAQSKGSLSKPLEGDPLDNQPYKKRTYSVEETKQIVEKLYQDNLFEIKIDISSFFDSIYTHAIPWAMHTKAVAKKSNGKSLAGDKLDICFRGMNYGQTSGILIGNAASRIISEIILCKIDKQIQDKFKNIKYCRFVDDYSIFLKDSSQIQSVISFIRNELSKYELIINENKLQIIESPFIYDKRWVEEIKLFTHLDSEVFLNKIIQLYLDYKDNAILRYGLTVLYLHDINKEQWAAMESKIINLWVKCPSNADLIIKILLSKRDDIKITHVKKGLYSILDKCIPLNQHQETIWAVWFAKVFNIKIKKDYIKKILESRNSLAIIILLDIIYCNNTLDDSDKFIKQCLLDLIERLKKADIDINEDDVHRTGNLMWSENWLLAYEADLNKWLNIDNNKFEYARKDEFFKNLIRKKIFFYDKKFEYTNDVHKNKFPQYITKDEFLKYLNKVNKILKSKDSDNEYLDEIQKINENITNKIFSQSGTYY